MKKLVLGLMMAVFSTGSHAESGARLNSSEAERECQAHIQTIYATGLQIKFKARPTSSYSGGVYTFWINTTELSEDSRNSVGYLCEITRGGELVQLLQKDGRWRA